MKNLFYFLIACCLFSCTENPAVRVQSPDGKTKVVFGINDSMKMYYSVNYEDSTIILPSRLGFQIKEEADFGGQPEIISFSEIEVNKTWRPVYGERAEIPDHYNEVKILLQGKQMPECKFEITFRIYNEGLAFKTTFLSHPKNSSFTIEKEFTEFKLNNNFTCWASERAQSEIQKKTINELKQPVERPLLIEAGNNFIALGEAKLIDFARMKFIGEDDNSLCAVLDGEANIELPYTTPWRTIMIGKSPGELLENNFFYENLNDPCKIEDISWIKTGKVIREVTLTTKGGLACVDFAAENGLQYVEFDAGWYGPEGDETSDATTITVDPKRSPGPLDLHQVIKYAETKGIGILVYVNRRALEKQIDEILPLYKSWGIKGVKYGFVQVGSQEWTGWLHEAVKKAAENELMVDIHDEYRPTGFSRTYPNLLTQEGIRGDEESPTNEHTLKTLFTRMLAGAGDNTNCYFAPRVDEKMGGHVSQLAKAVMIYSPWQFLYWYDRPPNSSDVIGGVPGSKGFIEKVPELEFFKNMPTVWYDTKVLESKAGEFATIARKSGDDWFLGSLTGIAKKTLEIKTDFLDKNTGYEAIIYTHDPGSESSTKVKIEKQEVNSESVLDFEIAGNSGVAIHFQKK